ncbi:hypothetical protein GOBAR_DD07935 [Gossypium barbadense]|nr:hypothetical protein GOBAR_DD07935 [Gossypium barbadense]
MTPKARYVTNQAIHETSEEHDWGKLNRWPTPAQLPDMFERFPPPGEEGVHYDEEETSIAPPNYERVFKPGHSSTKGVVIYDPSQNNPIQTLGRRAAKMLAGCDKGKA